MSSTTNPEPPKTRASPLDFRNTELVSRLLAATPPYLYNMPMVPNSYFFSEMLRSFVQAKTERNNAIPAAAAAAAPRRPRKRSWTQTRSEYYQKEEKHHPHEMPNWKPPPPLPPPQPQHPQQQQLQEKAMYFDNKRTEIPLELTMDVQGVKPKSPEAQKMPPPPPASLVFPQEQSNPNGLILPPPPPIWYPPLYPAPYGIDPLHFFIDLRVSGHIYDRKNEKDASQEVTTQQPLHQPQPPQQQQQPPTLHQPQPETTSFAFKQSRHASAFSVPVPSKSSPMNLSSREEHKPLKFDVKSMGFEKCSNKTSTNYVMSNVSRIYRELGEDQMRTYKKEETEEVEETEEERRKRVKDLRALIGLELVVDYMNNGKPGQPPSTTTTTADESNSDNESAASSALEVVTVQDEIINV